MHQHVDLVNVLLQSLNSFQDLDFDELLINHSLSLDAAIMVSKYYLTIGAHIIIFVTQ